MKKFVGYLLFFVIVASLAGCEPCKVKMLMGNAIQGNCGQKDGMTVRPRTWKPVVVCDSRTFTAESSSGEELVWILDGEIVAQGSEFVYTVQDDTECRIFPRLSPHKRRWDRFHKKYHQLLVMEACKLDEVKSWVVVDGGLRCRCKSDNSECEDPDTDVDTDTYTEADTDTYTYTEAETDTYTETEAETDTYTETEAETDTYTETEAETDTDDSQAGSQLNNLVGSYTLTGFELAGANGSLDETSPLITSFSGAMTITADGSVTASYDFGEGLQDSSSFEILQTEASRLQVNVPENNCTDWLNYNLSGNNLTIVFPVGFCGNEGGGSMTLDFQKN